MVSCRCLSSKDVAKSVCDARQTIPALTPGARIASQRGSMRLEAGTRCCRRWALAPNAYSKQAQRCAIMRTAAGRPRSGIPTDWPWARHTSRGKARQLTTRLAADPRHSGSGCRGRAPSAGGSRLQEGNCERHDAIHFLEPPEVIATLQHV
jgi:hypothetical protein